MNVTLIYPHPPTILKLSMENFERKFTSDLKMDVKNQDAEFIKKKTRMHSSRMRTAHVLTVFQHALGRGVYPSMHWVGGCLPGRGCLPRVGGRCLPRGMSAQRGCLPRRDGCLPGGVSAQGGGCPGGVCLGDVCPEGVCPKGVSAKGWCGRPPVDRMADRYKNITLPQIRKHGYESDTFHI